MSISIHIVGYQAPDETWEAMLKIWEYCAMADIEPPKRVVDFFDGEDPRGKPGMEIDISNAIRRIEDEASIGLEIDLEKLPPDMHYIRFYNEKLENEICVFWRDGEVIGSEDACYKKHMLEWYKEQGVHVDTVTTSTKSKWAKYVTATLNRDPKAVLLLQ